jgi:hypothetical protein
MPPWSRAWPGLGACLAAILGGQTMGLWVEDQGQIHELVATVPAEALAVYQQYYYALDLYAMAAARQPQLTALLARNWCRRRWRRPRSIPTTTACRLASAM